MRRLYKFFLAVTLLLTFFTLTAEVRADQVRLITSGFVSLLLDPNPDEEDSVEYSLSGPGFALDNFSSDAIDVSPCDLCLPGEVVDLTYEISLDGGNVRIDDVNCDEEDGLCLNIGDSILAGGQFRLPSPPPGETPFTFTVPMSLSGDVSVYECTDVNEFGGCNEFGKSASALISGRGHGRVSLAFDRFSGTYVFNEVRYTNEPIPEPTTMLLLGTGLAGIGGVIRRRRLATRQAK